MVLILIYLLGCAVTGFLFSNVGFPFYTVVKISLSWPLILAILVSVIILTFIFKVEIRKYEI